MALPFDRSTTYDLTSPVRSRDLNDMQDAIGSLWTARVAALSMDASPLIGGRGSPAADFVADDAVTYNGAISGAAHWTWALPLPAGARVLTVTVWGVAGTYDTTGDIVSLQSKALATGALTSIASVNRRTGTSPWIITTSHLVTSAETMLLRWSPGTSTAVLYACRVGIGWG